MNVPSERHDFPVFLISLPPHCFFSTLLWSSAAAWTIWLRRKLLFNVHNSQRLNLNHGQGILAQQWAQMTQREHHGIKSYPRAVVQMMPHPSPQQDMVLLSGSAALTYQCQAAVNCRGQILLYRCLGCQYKDEPGNIIILHTRHRHLFSVKRIVLSSGKLVLFPT